MTPEQEKARDGLTMLVGDAADELDAVDTLLARPDLIAQALGGTVRPVYGRYRPRRDGLFDWQPYDKPRQVIELPWQPAQRRDDDPEAEAAFWQAHHDQAGDDAEKEAGA